MARRRARTRLDRILAPRAIRLVFFANKMDFIKSFTMHDCQIEVLFGLAAHRYSLKKRARRNRSDHQFGIGVEAAARRTDFLTISAKYIAHCSSACRFSLSKEYFTYTAPRYRAYRGTDMVEHQTDRVRVDTERRHARRHRTAQIVDAEVGETECGSGSAHRSRSGVSRDWLIA